MFNVLMQKYGPTSGRFLSTLGILSIWCVCIGVAMSVTLILNTYVRGNQKPLNWQPAPMSTPVEIQATRIRSQAFQSKSLKPLTQSYKPGESIKVEIEQGDMNAWIAVEMKNWAKKNNVAPRLVDQMVEPHVIFQENQVQLNFKINIQGNVQPVSLQFELIGGKTVDPIDFQYNMNYGWNTFIQQNSDGVRVRILSVKIGRVQASLTDIVDVLSEYTSYMDEKEKELLEDADSMSKQEIEDALISKYGSREAAKRAVTDRINAEVETTEIVVPLSWFGGQGHALLEGMKIDNGKATAIMTTVEPGKEDQVEEKGPEA